MPHKPFLLSAEQIRPLATGFGSCLATDRIVVAGQKIGYCYREAPDSSEDSGWRFFAGDEPQEYIEDPSNLGLYDVNTIANYDPELYFSAHFAGWVGIRTQRFRRVQSSSVRAAW